MVSATHAGHAGADLFDDTGRLVAKDHRQAVLPLAFDDVIVAVAYTRGADAYLHLTRPGWIEPNVFYVERLSVVIENRGLHSVEHIPRGDRSGLAGP